MVSVDQTAYSQGGIGEHLKSEGKEGQTQMPQSLCKTPLMAKVYAVMQIARSLFVIEQAAADDDLAILKNITRQEISNLTVNLTRLAEGLRLRKNATEQGLAALGALISFVSQQDLTNSTVREELDKMLMKLSFSQTPPATQLSP
jgi:hypothetical protein